MSPKRRNGTDSLMTGHMGHGRWLSGEPLAALSGAGVPWGQGGCAGANPVPSLGFLHLFIPIPGGRGQLEASPPSLQAPHSQPKPRWHLPAWPLKQGEIFKALSLTRWLLSLQAVRKPKPNQRQSSKSKAITEPTSARPHLPALVVLQRGAELIFVLLKSSP